MTTIVTKKTMKSPLSSFISFVILRVAVLSSLSILMASTSLSSGSFLAVSAFSVSPPMIDKNRHHLRSSSWSKSSSSPHSNSNLIMLKAGLFGEQGSAYNNDINNNYNNQIRNVTTYISSTSDWQIYVDQSKASLDRGGSATLDAFCSLCGPVPSLSSAENIMDENNNIDEDNDSDDNIDDDNIDDDNIDDDDDNNVDKDDDNISIKVQIIAAILPKPVSGGKAPWIRCMWNNKNTNNRIRSSPNLDVSNVDSVDKVYRILTKHLGVKNVSREVCECLKWKYKGNNCLESGEIKLAIDSYNEALSICEDYYCNENTNTNTNPSENNSNSKNIIIMKQQEGVILLLRASAFLRQAQSHKEILQKEVEGDEWKLTDSEVLIALASDEAAAASELSASTSSGSITMDEYEKVMTDTVLSEADHDYTTVNTTTDTLADDDGGGDKKTETWSIPWLSSLFDKNKTPSDIDDDDDDNNNNSNLLDRTVIRLSILQKLQTNGTDIQKGQLRRIQYRHGLYQTSLLQATKDSLRSTELLPEYTSSWILAGELLSDLWKIKESRQYYEKAMSLVVATATATTTTTSNVDDENYLLKESIMTLLDGLGTRQDLLDQQARANKKWSKDSVRLALDIAG